MFQIQFHDIIILDFYILDFLKESGLHPASFVHSSHRVQEKGAKKKKTPLGKEPVFQDFSK